MRELLCIVMLAGALACSPGSTVLDVALPLLPDSVVSVEMTASVNGHTLGHRAQRRGDRYRVILPDDTSGDVDLVVGGMDGQGCQVALGRGGLFIPGPGVYPLGVTVEEREEHRGCQVRVLPLGDAAGRVWSEPAGIDCTSPTQRGPCTAAFPLGTQVRLFAEAQAQDYPEVYFAGWTGACAGQEACAAGVGPATVLLGATFLPRRQCSRDGWCWENPLPRANQLFAVGGTSDQDVWAVGAQGTLLHWNGTFLVPVPSGTTVDLLGLWAVRTDDIWAVGDAGTALHWSGFSWAPVATGTRATLLGVWGSGPADVWASGYDTDGGVLLHWDGARWSLVLRTEEGLYRVWGSGSRDVWVTGGGVAGGVILRWDGTAWHRQPPGAGSLYALWGTGPRDVWGVGANTTGEGLVSHWNGAAWTTLLQLPDMSLEGVWGSSASDIWIAGHVTFAPRGNGFLAHWDGKTWSSSYQSGENYLTAVWAGSKVFWTVGGGGAVLRWNGAYWTSLNGGLHLPDLLAIGGSGPNDVWAAGEFGAVARWRGASWQSVSLPAVITDSIHAILSFAPNDILLAGANQGIRLDVTTNTPRTNWTPGMALWAKSPDEIWSVGPGGRFSRLREAGVVSFACGMTGVLFGVWGSGPNDVWAVGDDATILRYTGGPSCQKVRSGAKGEVLRGIWGSGPDDIWAVGYRGAAQGILFHWDGVTWAEPAGVDVASLFSVWGSGPKDVWAGGAAILHWNGAAWSKVDSGTTGAIFQIWGSGADDVWAVGSDGAILHHVGSQGSR